MRAVGEAVLPRVLAARPAPRAGVGYRLLRDRAAIVGLILVAGAVLAAVGASVLTPHDPVTINLAVVLQGSSRTHPLGTDNLGRDVLSRLLYGARPSLGTAATASLLILAIGVTGGTISGYAGGRVDEVLMRVVDVLLAFPSLILALAIAGMLGPGLVHVMIAMAAVWWVGYARIVRGLVLSVRERQFVEAARAVGGSHARIIVRHVLPNVMGPVIVLVTLDMGGLILAISGLNFLGLGVQPPWPEWGAMLNEGRPFLFSVPRLMIYPGLAISLVVIGFNMLGDALRDVLDPRLRGGQTQP
ncbi:MAG: nickel transporter permease [Armatimonadota bacterium]